MQYMRDGFHGDHFAVLVLTNKRMHDFSLYFFSVQSNALRSPNHCEYFWLPVNRPRLQQ